MILSFILSIPDVYITASLLFACVAFCELWPCPVPELKHAGGNESRLVAAATSQLNKLPFYHSFWNRTTKVSLVSTAYRTSYIHKSKHALSYFLSYFSACFDIYFDLKLKHPPHRTQYLSHYLMAKYRIGKFFSRKDGGWGGWIGKPDDPDLICCGECLFCCQMNRNDPQRK